MDSGEKNRVLIDSLLAMRSSLMSSYEMKTNVREEGLLLRGLTKEAPEYLVFADYRHNEGRRRLLDAVETIDSAVKTLPEMEYRNASVLYLTTLRSVAKITRMANVLECTCPEAKTIEKDRAEGIAALKAA
jgi:hypothetical protein